MAEATGAAGEARKGGCVMATRTGRTRFPEGHAESSGFNGEMLIRGLLMILGAMPAEMVVEMKHAALRMRSEPAPPVPAKAATKRRG